MTIIRTNTIGNQIVVPAEDWERILAIARRVEAIELQPSEEDLPASGLMMLAEQGGAFAWLANEDDLYSVDDLKVRYQ